MAPVELDIYKTTPSEVPSDVLEDKHSVEPGAYEMRDDFLPATLFVFCHREDQEGTLQVENESGHLKVVLYRDDEDEGQVLNHSLPVPIKFSGPEMIDISSTVHKRVIVLSHVSSQSQEQETTSSAEILAEV